MLKLGTVFSGIGAIEHALSRLSIEYEISFACDNGNIELNLEKDEIEKNLLNLSSFRDKKNYIDELYLRNKKKNFVEESYKANYNISQEHFHYDVRFLDGHQYRNEIDLLVGGSPCQSFSMVGKRGGFEDTRGTLFYEFARLVNEIRPKVFIYENVKGVLSHDGGNTWTIMQNVFSDLGYKWYSQVLNSKNYGIPQNRERLFVVGFLDQTAEFDFPSPQILTKTMQDFLLENTPEKYYLGDKGIDFVTSAKNLNKQYTQINGSIGLCQKANQQFNWHGDFIFEELPNPIDEKYFLSEKLVNYVMATGTKGFYTRPKIDLEIARPLLATMTKMHRAGVDNYVTTQGRIRKLTPRECLRLMGFCDSFKIVVSDTQAYRQAGNSIVVDVLMSIVKQINLSVDLSKTIEKKQLQLI
ncbi:DNA cytosine methyltransferase [Vitreoscilla stercoraria]|uniref:Cytosine-specific methyltransferase n=1 Tax=Vitreoscilla stercoraria TaxID=61 RepID=A0ABY4EDF0_VITST|nr:DNA cytosine methyltransferase [Vitreoscilla stercoraria]UOO93759.1 DNA cytosine methyltransferase [Vitreoscilla stercoraria]